MTVSVIPAMVPKTGKPGFRWGGMRIGVDVGGTKIEAAALDKSDQVAARLRVPTPRGDYPATVEAVAGSSARSSATPAAKAPSASECPVRSARPPA